MSVVIPTYNRADLLGQAIESVLNQTFTDLELIVVDDGSTDHTEKAVRAIPDPRLRYIQQRNRGASAARNTGIHASEGELVAFLDHDDLFLPGKLSAQLGVVEDDPSVGLVYSLFYSTRRGGRRKLQGQCYPPGSRNLPDGPKILPSALLIQRSWLEQMGGFDEAIDVVADTDLIWRLSMSGCRMVCVPQPLFIRRMQEASMSRDFHRHAAQMLAFVNKIFDDPRMPAGLRPTRQEVCAKYLVMTAASAYLAADPEVGRDMLERAIAMDPNLADRDVHVLARRFVHFVIGHSTEEPEATLRLAMRSLPRGRSFAARFARHAWHEFFMDKAFENHEFGERLMSRKFALRAILKDPPSALRNRGLLSVLVRSLIANS